MFYSKCFNCGNEWGIGSSSTCTCPEEIEWSKTTIPVEKLASLTVGSNPSYMMTFHKDGKQVAALDWNGPEMKFSGDLDESAKLLFELLAQNFKGRLEKERALEREACAKVCDELAARDKLSNYYKVAANAIRARGNHANG